MAAETTFIEVDPTNGVQRFFFNTIRIVGFIFKLFYLRDRTGKATRLRERKAKPWEVDPNAKSTGAKKSKKGKKK